MRLMRNFGFSGEDETACVGCNAKMSEAAAAMGLTSLESFARFRAANERNYRAYRARLNPLPGFRVMDYDENEQHNYQYVVVEIDRRAAGVSRDELMSVLRAENVLARRYFYPGCHRMEPYRSLDPDAPQRLPATEAAADRVLVLPNGPSVGLPEIETIGRILSLALEAPGRLRKRLAVHAPSLSLPATHQLPLSAHATPVPN
jgi:dTDP-4-amino-4,6-dideoxygalactose transaminase